MTQRLLECRSVVASEGLGVWGGLWIQVMGDLLLPLMADLARYVSTRYREFPGVCVCVPSGIRLLTQTICSPLTHSSSTSPMDHYSSACALDQLFVHSCIHPFIGA